MGDFMEKIELSGTGKKYAVGAAVCILVYFFMRFLSPVFSPFLLAFLLTGLLNPLTEKLHQKVRIKKSVLAGLLLFLAAALLIVLLWLLICSLVENSGRLTAFIPECQRELCRFLGDCCDSIEKKFGVDGVVIENFVMEQVHVLTEKLEVNVFPALMGKSVDYLKNAAGFISFFVVAFIAVLLLQKDYDHIVNKLKNEESLKGVREISTKVITYIKTFIKAQLIILCVISALCGAALWLLGMRGGVLYGIITGFMDMLPFIGTGIMLIPVAVIWILNGRYWQAAGCLILYGACCLIRELLEPKLIGNKVGIWPVGILFAVFAGIRLFGLWGIIKGPLSLVIICETCRYLWEQE